MTAGEIVLTYHLDGVKQLRLPRDVYPKIFLGEITKWNDPAIAAANPGVKLPAEDITVVVRADSSGTNFNFTHHLSAVSEAFKSKVGAGTTVDWKVEHLVKSPKNDGVAATIRQTPGSIGYVEYGYAVMAKLPMEQTAGVALGAQTAVTDGDVLLDCRVQKIFYGDFLAVRDSAVPIARKQITGFIGPSGCGKSTVLRSINRM